MKNKTAIMFFVSVLFVSCSNQGYSSDSEIDPLKKEFLNATSFEAGTHVYSYYLEISGSSPNKDEYSSLAATIYSLAEDTDLQNTEDRKASIWVKSSFYLKYHFDSSNKDNDFGISFYCIKEDNLFFVIDDRKDFVSQYIDSNNNYYNRFLQLHEKSKNHS